VTRIGSTTASPDESNRNAPHGVIQSVKNIFGGGTRAQDTILAVAIVVIVFESWLLFSAYKDMHTQQWLSDYDLNQFKSGPFAELKARVDTDDALIKAFGPQQCRKTP
jgi:hypothetical protein